MYDVGYFEWHSKCFPVTALVETVCALTSDGPQTKYRPLVYYFANNSYRVRSIRRLVSILPLRYPAGSSSCPLPTSKGRCSSPNPCGPDSLSTLVKLLLMVLSGGNLVLQTSWELNIVFMKSSEHGGSRCRGASLIVLLKDVTAQESLAYADLFVLDVFVSYRLLIQHYRLTLNESSLQSNKDVMLLLGYPRLAQ